MHIRAAGRSRARLVSCGTPELDNYLRLQARQDAKRKVAAPIVMVDAARRVVGYYILLAYGIRPAKLPPKVAKKLPKYPLIPATLLGRLAVSKEQTPRAKSGATAFDGCSPTELEEHGGGGLGRSGCWSY